MFVRSTSGISLLVNQFERMGLNSDDIAEMSNLTSVAPHDMAAVVNNLGTIVSEHLKTVDFLFAPC